MCYYIRMNTVDKFNSLNSEQKQALVATNGAVLVTAGAGSGKTRLLTHRIAYLIEKMFVPAINILAITFTNKAANEMKERVTKITPDGKNVWISTFHSMCVRILRSHIHRLDPSYNQNFSIYADSDSEKVLKVLIAEKNLADSKIIKNVLYHLSNMKNNNISLYDYKKELDVFPGGQIIYDLMRGYEQSLASNNALDFDDLLTKTYELFKTCPDVLNFYAERFKYILVDEFQDTNKIQYELVKLLASVHKNIFVVGDEDQCIYTWRGANFRNISNFTKDFENVQVFKLEQNYRSTKTILNLANKLIKNNKSRIDKTLWCENGEGEPVAYKQLYDEQAEADHVAKTIHDLVENSGASYNDFAILVRFNALTFPFEEKLLSYDIPYKIYGGFKFYERVEVKNILAYLRLFINQKDEQAFARVVNFPKRGIGDTSVQKLRELARNLGVSMLEICLEAGNYPIQPSLRNKLLPFANTYKKLFAEFELQSLDSFAREVVESFNIKSAYNSNSEEDFDKLANIDQLLGSIAAYAKKNPEDTLSDYLQSVSLISDLDNMGEDGNVIVATMHAVKGLEFKNVFLVGLEEKVMPISRAYGDDAQMEEERRLMYVGITRAKERLFLTNAQTRYLYGHRDYMMASRFVGELDLIPKFEARPKFTTAAARTTLNQVDNIKNNLKNGNAYVEFLSKQAKDISIYAIGQTVLHSKFGMGVIVDIDLESKTADIDFKAFGVRTLMLEIAPLKIIK